MNHLPRGHQVPGACTSGSGKRRNSNHVDFALLLLTLCAAGNLRAVGSGRAITFFPDSMLIADDLTSLRTRAADINQRGKPLGHLQQAAEAYETASAQALASSTGGNSLDL